MSEKNANTNKDKSKANKKAYNPKRRFRINNCLLYTSDAADE